jgi:hypothetical protein
MRSAIQRIREMKELRLSKVAPKRMAPARAPVGAELAGQHAVGWPGQLPGPLSF